MSSILDVQNVYDNILTIQQIHMSNGEEVERIKRPTKVISICHDPVNDMVMLVRKYEYGAMMGIESFPTFQQESYVALHDTIKNQLEAEGITVKGSRHLFGYMESHDIAWEPVEVYYTTFDSRDVQESTKVRLLTAKALYQEVIEGNHNDMGVTYGAHFLKMMHHNLIK